MKRHLNDGEIRGKYRGKGSDVRNGRKGAVCDGAIHEPKGTAMGSGPRGGGSGTNAESKRGDRNFGTVYKCPVQSFVQHSGERIMKTTHTMASRVLSALMTVVKCKKRHPQGFRKGSKGTAQ